MNSLRIKNLNEVMRKKGWEKIVAASTGLYFFKRINKTHTVDIQKWGINWECDIELSGVALRGGSGGPTFPTLRLAMAYAKVLMVEEKLKGDS
jgi:hypothetical protein